MFQILWRRQAKCPILGFVKEASEENAPAPNCSRMGKTLCARRNESEQLGTGYVLGWNRSGTVTRASRECLHQVDFLLLRLALDYSSRSRLQTSQLYLEPT